MSPTPMLTLPPPWRRFLAKWPSLPTGSAAYARIVDAYQQQRVRLFASDADGRWRVDRPAGLLRIERADGSPQVVRVESIGRHEQGRFHWTVATPGSPADAAVRSVRDALVRVLPELHVEDALEVGASDVLALMSLCAATLGAGRIFVGPSRSGPWQVLLLKDNGDAAPQASEGGRAMPPPSPAASLFNGLDDLLARQVAAHQVPDATLEAIEPMAARAATRYESSDFAGALAEVEAAKQRLGPFFVDQPPAGWLLTCEAACRLALAEPAAAARCFRMAARAADVPDRDLIRLGRARSEPWPQDRDSELAALYLASPERFLQLASEAERDAMTRRIDRLEGERADDATPEQVLRAVLSARVAHEREAWRRFDAARSRRTLAHVKEDEDARADDDNDADYRALLLTWFTVPARPHRSSFGSPPSQDPARLSTTRAISHGPDSIDFHAEFDADHGHRDHYRYRLVRRSIPLSGRALWRVEGMWSVWPDEEIPLL